MITLRTNGYTKQNFEDIYYVATTGLDILCCISEKEPKDSDPCKRCSSRHVCKDLKLLIDFAEKRMK